MPEKNIVTLTEDGKVPEVVRDGLWQLFNDLPPGGTMVITFMDVPSVVLSNVNPGPKMVGTLVVSRVSAVGALHVEVPK